MVNKRGWIRIVEASLAIMIVLGVLLVLNARTKTITTIDLSEKISPLLEEIASNETLREEIVGVEQSNIAGVEAEIKNFLSKRINNPSLDYSIRVCMMDDVFCPLSPLPEGEVYAGERIVSSTLREINPRRLKVFIWVK
jgi:low affinity Fe/Cu permease